MKNLEIQSLFRCIKRTFHYDAANYPGSRIACWADNEICLNWGLTFHIVPCMHQRNINIERKLRECRTYKLNPCFGAKSVVPITGLQTTRVHASRYRSDNVICRNWGLLFTWYRVCTKAILTSKAIYGDVQPRNAFLVSVQKAYFTLRGCKLHGFTHRV